MSYHSRLITIRKTGRMKIISGIGLVILLIAGYWWLSISGGLSTICDCDSLHEYILRLGKLGPLVMIGLMSGAIVLSPIPSAPIALAAGLAYGHAWGTIYIVIGAELGAIIAFTIARLLGYELLHRWFGEKLSMGLLGSQNTLMAVVFIGRLLPFISFDILSYAAGLTSLAFWRFAIATLAGIIPISFLLTHFGRELGSADMQRISFTVLALGGITSIPFAVKWIVDRRQKQSMSK